MRSTIWCRATGRALLAVGGMAIVMALLPAGSAAKAGASSAVPSWDPQTTNVPYLAWVGEEIRLTKCFDAPAVTSADSSAIKWGSISSDFLVEDWSASSQLPQVEPNTVRTYWSRTLDAVCAEGDVVSLLPGMARVELDVVDPGNRLGLGGGTVIKHQFLAGWMTLNTPTLTELSASSFPASAQTEAAKELGDPSGNGQFTAGGRSGWGSGYLDVKVTGSMPMTGPWATLVGSSTVTLPTDWVTLAHALASDDNPLDLTPWNTWDTSGDSLGYEGHVTPTPPCAAVPPQFASIPIEPLTPNSYTTTLDNVDNCTGGGPDGPFSRVFGDLSAAGASIGPFDPLFPSATLLPDGNLDAQDAPMPAARIDVTIAPNSGSTTDLGGAGYLAPADKTKTYSRDFLGNDGVPDNLYAPFYDAYIPATSRPGDASSGVDGGSAGNFNGFLVDGKYHFWDFAATLASGVGTATDCLERASNPETANPTSNPGDFYQTPSGPSSVAVYTDQNGEAQVQFVPGLGFYFDNLIGSGAAITNADGGCDLQSLFGVTGGLGTANITATAVYPFKPVDYPSVTSAAVSKTVSSLWSKALAYFPKGSGAANNNARIVVAHAQSIDGSPDVHEIVCFASNAEGMSWFDGTIDNIDLGGTSLASGATRDTLGQTCVRTDSNGNAAVEVLESDPVMVNVIADFANEGILRSISVDFTTPGSSGGSLVPPMPGPSSAPSSQPGTGEPSPAVLKSVGVKLPTRHVNRRTTRIVTADLITTVHGARYLLVRIDSSARRARVRVRMTGRNGRTLVRVFTVRTNHLVKVNVGQSIVRIKKLTLVR